MKNRFIANWGRLILAMAMVVGFGWLSPIGSDGASATPHRDDHNLSGYEITGRVTAIVGSNEFTLTAKGHLAFKVHVSSSTKYVELGVPKGIPIGFNYLAVGDMVQVKGTKAGDRDVDAVLVRLPVFAVIGLVKAVTSSEITLGKAAIYTTPKHYKLVSSVIVDISVGTVFKVPGVSNPRIGDILRNDFVEVLGTKKTAIPGHQSAPQVDATAVVVLTSFFASSSPR